MSTPFKPYYSKNEKRRQYTDAIVYLRNNITKPPFNFKWLMTEPADLIADLIINNKQRDEISLAEIKVPDDLDLYITVDCSSPISSLYNFSVRLNYGMPSFAWYDEFENTAKDIFKITDYIPLVKANTITKQPNSILTYCFFKDHNDIVLDIQSVKRFVDYKSLHKHMVLYHYMIKNTWEDTIAALRFIGTPELQITVFKIRNGLPVSDDEKTDDLLIGLT